MLSNLAWVDGDTVLRIFDVTKVNPFLVPLKANSKGLKKTASITSPLAIIKYCQRIEYKETTWERGNYTQINVQEGRKTELIELPTMTIMPKIVRPACCASCHKLSSLDPPNHLNQPPPPESPPPPASSLFLISLSHFSNSVFFPPSALSNAFLACSCYMRCAKVNPMKQRGKRN